MKIISTRQRSGLNRTPFNRSCFKVVHNTKIYASLHIKKPQKRPEKKPLKLRCLGGLLFIGNQQKDH